MINASQLINMPVICMDEGRAAGHVSGLLIDGARRCAVCLLVDMGAWYLGVQALSFDRVIGVGEDAVMTGGLRELRPLGQDDKLVAAARVGARIEGAKAYTPKGELLGTAKDFAVDEAGQILSVELDDGRVIPQRALLAIGPDALIADIGRETTVVRMGTPPEEREPEPQSPPIGASAPVPMTVAIAPTNAPQNVAQTASAPTPPPRSGQSVSLGNVTVRAGQSPAAQGGVPLPRG